MTCDCAEKVNENLAEYGKGGSQLALTINLDGTPGLPMLEVGRRGEPWKKPLKGNPQFIVPTYCPFCGEPYETDAQEGESDD